MSSSGKPIKQEPSREAVQAAGKFQESLTSRPTIEEGKVWWAGFGFAPALAHLLDTMMLKRQLSEAKWWHEMNDEANDALRRYQCCERVADLERQLASRD